MGIPRFLQFEGYEITDVQTTTRDHKVFVHLKPRHDKHVCCRRCQKPLSKLTSKHPLTLKDLPLRGFETILKLWRRKGWCDQCKKTRSEHIAFLSKESPHFTQDYTWWLGTMCEFSPVSRVAEMVKEQNMTVRRIDLKRMQQMLKKYKIPDVTHIAVDEVYARKKSKYKDENRNERFFTVISDLNTRRVIWVSESRSKKALDEFFKILGKSACERIQVVAIDQHDDYAKSVREHCKKAKIVWDKFHLMQTFGEALNEVRKSLHDRLDKSQGDLQRLTRGKYRFLFLKNTAKRSQVEKDHIDDVVRQNEDFSALEIIKEGMISFFDSLDLATAKERLTQIGKWIDQKIVADMMKGEIPAFRPLETWYKNISGGWETLKNYFEFRVTSALAEGINNVIKALKRRAFGYRNMDYFRLKIMQVCGYLNSRYIKFAEQLGT
jgi:transposase